MMMEEFKECRHIKNCKCLPERPMVFVDESYVHEHHVANYGLTIENSPLHKPSGKGRRVVMAGAYSQDGFLGFDNSLGPKDWENNMLEFYQNGSVKYWSAQVGGDYHKNFNGETFEEYFRECVLDYLEQPSLIILDRASYHMTYPDGTFYPTKAKKVELRQWLIDHEIDFDESLLKEELKLLVMCYWNPPKTIIEELAENHGLQNFGREHRVIFLPPYHPEFNGIEFAWGRIKNFIGKKPAYNLKTLMKETLIESFHHISVNTSREIYAHIKRKLKEAALENIDSENFNIIVHENDDY